MTAAVSAPAHQRALSSGASSLLAAVSAAAVSTAYGVFGWLGMIAAGAIMAVSSAGAVVAGRRQNRSGVNPGRSTARPGSRISRMGGVAGSSRAGRKAGGSGGRSGGRGDRLRSLLGKSRGKSITGGPGVSNRGGSGAGKRRAGRATGGVGGGSNAPRRGLAGRLKGRTGNGGGRSSSPRAGGSPGAGTRRGLIGRLRSKAGAKRAAGAGRAGGPAGAGSRPAGRAGRTGGGRKGRARNAMLACFKPRSAGGRARTHQTGREPIPTRRTVADEVARRAANKRSSIPTPRTAPAHREPTPLLEGTHAMPSPFAPLIEAADACGQSYDPDRAKTVLECVEGMPEAIDALARLWTNLGTKNTEEFEVDPAVAEVWRALGTYFGQLHEPISEASAVFRRTHERELERIENPTPHAAKWDVAANAD